MLANAIAFQVGYRPPPRPAPANVVEKASGDVPGSSSEDSQDESDSTEGLMKDIASSENDDE